MVLYTTVVIRGYIYDIIVLTSSIYSVINLKAFLEHQIFKGKPTPLLAIKTWNFYTTLMQQLVIFFTHGHFFSTVYSLQVHLYKFLV